MARSSTTLKLGQETWGDSVHRAYRVARQNYNQRDPKTGESKFSYRVVADKLSAAGLDVVRPDPHAPRGLRRDPGPHADQAGRLLRPRRLRLRARRLRPYT